MQESGLAQKVERTLSELETIGVEPTLSRKIYVKIVKAGFNRATLASAFVLMQLAAQFQPINVRGLMYRAIGLLYPDSSDKSYNQTSHVVLKLRRAGIMPFSWIVDSTRRRLKPSTWTSLADFAQAVANAYRKDLWTNQKHHVEIFSEKDAMVGVVEPVTEALDVHCNIIRGQNSETSVYNTAEEWNQIKKPIYVYYIGDHDPDGFRIETSLKSRLAGYCDRPFEWERLAISPSDFADQSLRGYPLKTTSKRGQPLAEASWKPYFDQYGDRCVEVDAVPPDVIRQRIRQAIESHIDTGKWKRLQRIEAQEREDWAEQIHAD